MIALLYEIQVPATFPDVPVTFIFLKFAFNLFLWHKQVFFPQAMHLHHQGTLVT